MAAMVAMVAGKAGEVAMVEGEVEAKVKVEVKAGLVAEGASGAGPTESNT